jgi:hypothetical protein
MIKLKKRPSGGRPYPQRFKHDGIYEVRKRVFQARQQKTVARHLTQHSVLMKKKEIMKGKET